MFGKKGELSKAQAAAVKLFQSQLEVLLNNARKTNCIYNDYDGGDIVRLLNALKYTVEEYSLGESMFQEALMRIYNTLMENENFSTAAQLAKDHKL